MDKITSESNAGLKKVIQLRERARVRNREKSFLIEGPRMLAETPREMLLRLYVSESYYQAHQNTTLRGYTCDVVADRLFEKITDTKTPQGVLGIVRQLSYSLEDLLVSAQPHLLLLEDLQDPGNLGTIVRTAEGAGADGIIMTKSSADIYNPKVVRATMGSIYRMPFYYADDLAEVIDQLKENGIQIYAAALEGSVIYDKVDCRMGTAFLIGNEGNGLSPEILGKSDQNIKIPMQGQVESLNAAIAASLLTYEAYRQRRR